MNSLQTLDLFLPVATATVFGLLALMVLRPGALIAVGLMVWGLNMWKAAPLQGSAVILIGLLFIAVAIVKSARRGVGDRRVSPVSFFLLAFTTLGVALAPASVAPIDTLSRLVGSLLLGGAVVATARWVPGRTVVVASFCALTPYVLASYVVELAGLTDRLNDRWMGTTPNPNALAVLALVYASLSFGLGRRAALFAIPLSAGLSFMSASRGGTVALIVALAAGLWVGNDSAGPAQLGLWLRRAAVVLAIAVGSLVLRNALQDPYQIQDSDSLIRTESASRLQILGDNWEAFLDRPFTGHGFAATPTGVEAGAHFLPVTVAVQLGLFGLIFLALFVYALLRTRWSHDPVLAALVFGSLVSFASESWLFGTGHVMTAVYWLAVSSLASDGREGAINRSRQDARTTFKETNAGSDAVAPA